MSRSYDRQAFLKKLEQAAEKHIDSFYAEGFLNYTDTCTDDRRILLVEVAAQYVRENWDRFETIPAIPRGSIGKTYNCDTTETGKEGSHRQLNPYSGTEPAPAEEVLLAKWMRAKEDLGPLGICRDYQVPIYDSVGKKDPESSSGDKVSPHIGKIDLVSSKEDKLFIIELKRDVSEGLKRAEESLLRCILEITTYQKQIEADHLCRDFGIAGTIVIPTVLVAEGTRPAQELRAAIAGDMPETMRLLDHLAAKRGLQVFTYTISDTKLEVQKAWPSK